MKERMHNDYCVSIKNIDGLIIIIIIKIKNNKVEVLFYSDAHEFL